MGLAFPFGTRIYVDTPILIYSVERHSQHGTMLDMLLVGLIKARDERMLQAYRLILLAMATMAMAKLCDAVF